MALRIEAESLRDTARITLQHAQHYYQVNDAQKGIESAWMSAASNLSGGLVH